MRNHKFGNEWFGSIRGSRSSLTERTRFGNRAAHRFDDRTTTALDDRVAATEVVA